MMSKTNCVAEIVSTDGVKHVAWVEKAFDVKAASLYRDEKTDKEKNLMHGAVTLNGSDIYFCDDIMNTGKCAQGVTLHLNVDDADAWFKKAVAAGAKSTMEMQDVFWGARYGRVVDPFGLEWSFCHQLPNANSQEPKKEAASPKASPAAKKRRGE